MKLLFTILLVFCCFNISFSQTTLPPTQVIINTLWQESFGNVSNTDWSSSTLDASGNLITTGNMVDSLGRIFVYLIKQNPSGTILWEKHFSPPNNISFGIGVTSDMSGSIYVSAATKGNHPKYDYLVLKYDASGSLLWNMVLDGPSNGDDIPTGIVHSGTQVFITGLSEGIGTLYDYWTLGLNSTNGAINWSSRYNFAGLNDTPAFLKLDNLGFLIISGVSASSLLNWELATLKYSQAGQIISQNRVSNNGLGIFLPSWLDIDGAGNIYVTGTHLSTPSNLDIKTVKINSDFTIGWQAIYDTPSTLDSSTVVKVDNVGNVFVSGYYLNANGGKNGILLKYNSFGNLIWQKARSARSSTAVVNPRRMEVDIDGNIIVAYESTDSSGSTVDLVGYNQLGDIKWVEGIKLFQNSINSPNGLILKSGDIIVSALNKRSAGNTYFNFRLNPFIRPITTSSSSQNMMKNEVIVRFLKGTTNSSFINDRAKRTGKVQDALDPSLINIIATKLQANDFGQWDVIKVFPNMTESDSLTYSYSGQLMRVPHFYNTLVLVIPRNYSRIVGESAIADTLLSNIFACDIGAASPNYIITPDVCIPNDPLYQNGQQGGLNPTPTFPSGSVNAEEAWCIWEGSSNIKVIVADFGIQWSHEDFGDGTFDGSVVVAGKDYITGGTMPEDFLSGYHGTNVGSIIGSIRNNAVGVAGIAGGSGDADGVRLVAHAIFSLGTGSAFIDGLMASLKDGVDVDAANIYNISGGTNDVSESGLVMLREVLSYVNAKGMVVCASRGNGNTTEYRYPACIHDELTISISGTKEDGTKDPGTRSMLVDVAAPSVSSLVTTADYSTTSNQEYAPFNGTSAATPHIAGQGALMMGYYANAGFTLSPDDLEFLIEKSATDVGAPGHDNGTGAGRANIGNVMSMIEMPKCSIFHFGIDTNPYTTTEANVTPSGATLFIALISSFTDPNGLEFPAGMYRAFVTQHDYWIEHNLPPNYEISEIWPRNSNSTLFSNYSVTSQNQGIIFDEMFFPKGGVDLIEYDNNIAHFRGFRYELEGWDCSECEGYIPNHPSLGDRVEYSILACDNSSGTNDKIINSNSIFIRPNPATDELQINLSDNLQELKLFKCFDSTGRLLYEEEINSHNINYNLSVTGWPPGVYILSFFGRKGILNQKFIKN